MITDDFGNLVSPPSPRTISQRLDDGDARMTRIETDLANNTKATQELGKSTAELVAFIQAMKGLFKVLDVIGRWARPISYIVALITALLTLWAAFKGHNK